MFTTAKEARDTSRDNPGTARENMVSEGSPVHDMKDSARRLRNDASAAAASIKEDLEDAARKTGRHVRDLADSAGHSVADVADSMTGKIRSNPVQSTFAALGIGFLVGLLYRRR